MLDNRMFFELNGTDYTEVDDDADIAVFTLINDYSKQVDILVNKSKIYISMEIWNVYEDQYTDEHWHEWLKQPNTYIISNSFSKLDPDRVIYVDFLFNRTKAYYEKFKFRPNTMKWYHGGNKCYTVPNLDVDNTRSRIFMSPVRVVPDAQMHLRPQKYRRKFYKDIIANYGHLGYYPDPIMYTNLDFDLDENIENIVNSSKQPKKLRPGYTPPHNAYYNDTFISFYVESLEHGQSTAVTEKTYDPLVKGHFILPFSTAHFVEHLKDLGIKFPPNNRVIKYHYDSIEDNEERYQAWRQEMIRLLDISVADWHNIRIRFKDILKHNQEWIFKRDYDRVDLSKLINE